MVRVATGFDRLDGDETEVKGLVFPVGKGFDVGDGAETGVLMLDFGKIRVVVMGMSDQNEIGGDGILFGSTSVRIDVDDFAFAGGEAKASVTKIEELVRGEVGRHDYIPGILKALGSAAGVG